LHEVSVCRVLVVRVKSIVGDAAIFVHYPSGMGRSKLKIPAAKTGTARNMNTVATLAEMASKP